MEVGHIHQPFHFLQYYKPGLPLQVCPAVDTAAATVCTRRDTVESPGFRRIGRSLPLSIATLASSILLPVHIIHPAPPNDNEHVIN